MIGTFLGGKECFDLGTQAYEILKFNRNFPKGGSVNFFQK